MLTDNTNMWKLLLKMYLSSGVDGNGSGGHVDECNVANFCAVFNRMSKMEDIRQGIIHFLNEDNDQSDSEDNDSDQEDNDESEKLFFDAVEDGECDIVDASIANGYIPHPFQLQVACEHGHIDIVTRLLACSAVSQHPEYFKYLGEGLLSAAANDSIGILNHLFLAGVDVNYANEEGYTGLHVAMSQCTKWLLDMGAKQFPNCDGETPLHTCCEYNDIESTKLLIEHPSDVLYTADNKGCTPLHLACEIELTDISQLLVDYHIKQGTTSLLELPDNKGCTPLNLACKYGSLQIVKLLIPCYTKQGFVLSDNKGRGPLHRACRYGFPESANIVQLLLEHMDSAEINRSDNKGRTFLHLACKFRGYKYSSSECPQNVPIRIVELLLESMDDKDINRVVEHVDNKGRTARNLADRNTWFDFSTRRKIIRLLKESLY